MKILLYNSNAEHERLDKTEYLNGIIELDGNLKQSCSLVHPSITINLSDSLSTNAENASYNILERLIGCNYAYIPDFKRYYYIDDIISNSRNMWSLTMSLDALMSYKDNILNLEAFVSRNEFTYDNMIRDDLVSYYYDKEVIETVPANGSKKNIAFTSSINILSNNAVITVLNDTIQLNTDTVTGPSNCLPNVNAHTAGASANSRMYAIYPTSMTHLAKRLIADDNLASYVISISSYPFVISGTGSDIILRLGSTELSGNDEVNVQRLANEMASYLVLADFTITADSFLDYEPYTKYDFYLPYLGWVNLASDNFLNKRLLFVYVVDYSSCSAQVSIIDDTDNKVLYTSSTQLGISIPINTTNAREVENNKLNNNISLGLGLASSAITTVAGIASGSPLAISGGALGFAKSISSYITNNNTNYERATGSVASGVAGVYLPQEVRVRKTSLKPKGYDANYLKYHAKPLNEVKKLNTLTGLTVVGNVHLEGLSNATSSEVDLIDSALRNGVIL